MSNMPAKVDRKQTALGFVLLIICIVLGGYVLVLFWKFISQSDPTIGSAIIAGIVTILVSVFSLIWSKRSDRQKQIEEAHREKKVSAYEEFLEFVFKLLVSSKSGKPLTTEEMEDFLSKFNQKMIVWGSDSVLKEFSNFRRFTTISSNGSNPQDASGIMFSLEKMLYAIRSDVGHGNKNLVKGDLLSLFITDIDDYLKLPSK